MGAAASAEKVVKAFGVTSPLSRLIDQCHLTYSEELCGEELFFSASETTTGGFILDGGMPLGLIPTDYVGFYNDSFQEGRHVKCSGIVKNAFKEWMLDHASLSQNADFGSIYKLPSDLNACLSNDTEHSLKNRYIGFFNGKMTAMFKVGKERSPDRGSILSYVHHPRTGWRSLIQGFPVSELESYTAVLGDVLRELWRVAPENKLPHLNLSDVPHHFRLVD